MSQYWEHLADELWTLIHQAEPSPDLAVAEGQVASNITDTLNELRAIQTRLLARRKAAVRMMVAQGLSYAEVAQAVGISRQRVEQLVNR